MVFHRLYPIRFIYFYIYSAKTKNIHIKSQNITKYSPVLESNSPGMSELPGKKTTENRLDSWMKNYLYVAAVKNRTKCKMFAFGRMGAGLHAANKRHVKSFEYMNIHENVKFDVFNSEVFCEPSKMSNRICLNSLCAE